MFDSYKSFKEYMRWSILSHLDSIGKIKHVLDYEVVVKNKICSVSSLANMYCILDVDFTLTKDSSIFEEFYYNSLPEVNKNIKRDLQMIKKIIKDIGSSPSDFSEPHAKLDKFLRKCELTKEQVIEAAVMTGESKNVKIIPYAFEAIIELEKINCKVGLNTGSVKEVVEEVSRKKIGIETKNIAATRFFYDKRGVFLKSWLNLGKNKEISMSNYFLPEAYCDLSITTHPELPKIIYVADKTLSPFERYVAAKVGSCLGIVLEVGENIYKRNEEFEYVVNAIEIREDLRKIKDYVQAYRIATIYPFLIKPEEAYEAIKLAEEINLSNFKNFEELLCKIQDFISLEILFPTLTTKIDKKLRGLKEKLGIGLKREDVEEIVNILKSFDFTFHVKKERKEELEWIIHSAYQ
ncbi:MAG: hypothetical protein QW040_00470 [Candidatus Aenigmatarchaeota archaeon]